MPASRTQRSCWWSTASVSPCRAGSAGSSPSGTGPTGCRRPTLSSCCSWPRPEWRGRWLTRPS
eukprot:7186560-Alexandrium_andersonii.AAC.1